MALTNAERQAAYRARRREVAPEQPDPTVARLRAQVRDLTDEVRRLKIELARRPAVPVPHQFNSRPFQPVPKVAGAPAVRPGGSRSPSATSRRGQGS